MTKLHWCQNERDGVSNHRHLDSLLNCLFRRRSKKISRLRVTGICEGNPPVTGWHPKHVVCRRLSAILFSLLKRRHNGRDGVSNHQPHDCLLNGLFRRRSKKTSKLRVTGNSPVTGEFPLQRASNAENASIWWRHHVSRRYSLLNTLFTFSKLTFMDNYLGPISLTIFPSQFKCDGNFILLSSK